MRKGSLSATVGLILLVIFIIILLPWVAELMASTFGKTKDKVCKISVAEHAASKYFDPLKKQGLDIHCERKKVVFSATEVTVDGLRNPVSPSPGSKLEPKYDPLTDHIVNQVLARELASCWEMMGAGELDVFNPDFAALESKTPCIVCSEVTFNDVTDKYTGLDQYLKSYKVPNTDELYFSYLSKSQSKCSAIPLANLRGENTLNIPDAIDVSKSKSYVIMFSGCKAPRMQNIVGLSDNAYQVILTDISSVEKYCTMLYN
jgi:hypothetical protein